jgi:tetratricopeptide (TPR) repeat protein/SAM-dependent methyltransferase
VTPGATPDVQAILVDAVQHHQAGRLDEAIAAYRQALVLDPACVGALNNLGTALCDQGKLEEAEASYRLALNFAPGDAEAHNNLGTVLYQREELDQAVASYRQALALRPDHAEAHNNLGTALFSLGKLDEALASYRSALASKPDFVSARIHLGTALWDQGKLDEAAAAFRQASAIDPHSTEALNRLAAVMMIKGDPTTALDIVWRSLQIAETDKSRRLFADIVKQTCWTRDEPRIRDALSRALAEPWARPGDLARVSANLIKLEPDIGAAVARAAEAWPKPLSARELFGSAGVARFAADKLLCSLLSSTQNTDIALERFLTMARRLMLQAATAMPAGSDEAGLNFHSALARQCFINEYVFFHAADEIRDAEKLRDALAAGLATGKTVPSAWVVAVAAYFPLHAVASAGRLLDMPWPAEVAGLLAQQIVEPREEEQLRGTIARATPIDDPVSRLVKAQYEENPYPRWIRMPPIEDSNTAMAYLSKRFPLAPFGREGASKRTQLLSAGCGTGQLAIEAAMAIKAQLLAVDLSLSSLAYAKRKARELGLTSIEFAQADILELGATDKRFDVIECSGVLHHMTNPFAGWLALLSLLRPGGFMQVGLYSQTARRDIARTRRLIAERDYGTSADDIRRCRQELLALDERESLGNATTSSDFFGISTCRDLLFHSQEQQMTLSGIAAFLHENGLTFLGFEMDGNVLQAYRKRFPRDPAATNLDHCQAFELDNPGTFAGMYIFWVQKPV